MTKKYEVEWLSNQSGRTIVLTEEVELLYPEDDPWDWAWNTDYYCLSVLSVKELNE